MKNWFKKISAKVFSKVGGQLLRELGSEKLLLKWVFVFPVIFFLAFVFSAHPAHAQFAGITADVIGVITKAIGYVITFVAGIAVAVLAWGIGVLLDISLGAVNSSAVQGGYNVTLALANLGFVLGIIIVAIATIIRNQTYGIKKFLYSVVVMAVMVNFGLVLAGGLINISNSLTQYFLDGITGGGGALQFSSTMTSAFQPQSLLDPFTKSQTEDPKIAKELSAGDGFSQMLQPIAGLVMIIVSMVLIIITLATFFVMLIIRYVYLVILLVLLPLAWMAGVFPYLAEHSKKWWSKFIQQVLFPPVALFFLWLALSVGKATFATPPTTTIGSLSSNTGVAAVIGSLAAGLIIPMLNIVVLSFLMVGGLMAADKLGGVGASAALGAAKGGGKAAGKWAGKRAVRGASRAATRTAPVQHPVGAGVNPLMKLVNRGRNAVNKGTFTLGTPLRAAARRTGLAENLSTSGEDQNKINEAKADLARLKEERRALRRGSAPVPTTVQPGALPNLPITDGAPLVLPTEGTMPAIPGTPQPLPGTVGAPPALPTDAAAEFNNLFRTEETPSALPIEGAPQALPTEGTPPALPGTVVPATRRSPLAAVALLQQKNDEIKKAKEAAGAMNSKGEMEEEKGLMASVFGGMKDGSGLFKKKKSKETESKTNEEWEKLGMTPDDINWLKEKGLVKKEKEKPAPPAAEAAAPAPAPAKPSGGTP